eukprot:4692339-Prymnesium_polylepis.1
MAFVAVHWRGRLEIQARPPRRRRTAESVSPATPPSTAGLLLKCRRVGKTKFAAWAICEEAEVVIGEAWLCAARSVSVVWGSGGGGEGAGGGNSSD